jgi:Fe(3+) dicitrate transport protein
MAEATFFWNDYQNITGTCSDSTGCALDQLDAQFNGGKARILGAEAQAAQNISWGRVLFPLTLNITWLQATFENPFASTGPEWGVGTVNAGDPLPYVPRFQYSFSVGMEYKRFKQEFDLTWQSVMADQAVSAGQQVVPAYGVVDWSSSWGVIEHGELFAKVDNLLGKDYLVSYRPLGARPGKPRSLMVGLTYRL